MSTTIDVGKRSGRESARVVSGAEVIVATTIGNAMEFFDFTAYNCFAVLLGKLFFPTLNPVFQLVMTTGIFAAGYFFRPLGGMVIGAFADKIGRKAALMLTVGLMALSSAMIGLAPTYQTIGIWAPILIVVSRILQGISAGGEVGAATALLVEYAGPNRRGYFGSFQFASQCLGIAAGAAVSAVLTRYLDAASLASWGWRVVFLMGIVIAPVGIYIRVRVAETSERPQAAERSQTLLQILSSHIKELSLGTVLTFGGTSANFIILFALPIIAMTSLKLTHTDAVLAGVMTGLVGFVISPIGGLVSDVVGRKPVILFSRVLVCVAVVPLFVWLRAEPTLFRLLIVEGALSAMAAFGGAPAVGAMTELFPRSVRATGMAIIYSLGVALSGVTTQFISTYFVGISSNIMIAAWYVVVCLVLTSVVLLWLPETNPRSTNKQIVF